ncbi:MAG: Asp-tRNA(Asn)/Glu-tRNA(Gln) amidotransferase subunit GatB [Candidatus Omnitrophota bacterium]|nr:Asp-tRNA(Asn)/Glu-tRNA(Gln) amidotransferase subunit GatB [Candidatus Omnitrophota bacterium]
MLETVIGLEVHVQLKTKTKAFCGCSTEFGRLPNSQVCPVCLGFPGSLPVLNKTVLEYGIKVGVALNCKIPEYTKFDRKNYFYPDLPKNYQISQYDQPLAQSGYLDIAIENGTKRITIKRVHLEEDAGKLIHEGTDSSASYVDYNRAGIPLLEIVSEPELNSPDEAYQYLTTLKSIIRYLDVSDCDMEKGSLRCDANISLRPCGEKKLGVKTELKNMNSFKAVKSGLEYEIKRQLAILEAGGKVTQQTLLWDEKKQKTAVMRSKEEAHDYRYFPEPDLVPFIFKSADIKIIKETIPELPQEKLLRFVKEFSLAPYEANILTSDKSLADFFEKCSRGYKNYKNLSNWIIGAFLSEINNRSIEPKDIPITPEKFTLLLNLADTGKINSLTAKTVLSEMFETQKSPDLIISEKNLSQISDSGELEQIITQIINVNEKSVTDYKNGKANALMFLIGQAMKQTKGKANPNMVTEMLKERIKNA